MKKYRYLLCLFVAFIFLMAPMRVSADIGPKPSVVVEFTGIEAEEYYVTLLSETDSTGPWSLGNEYYEYMGDESAFLKFAAYEDPDGYYFLSFMEECGEDHTFEWNYYPPSKFKILIYLPESDSFWMADGIYERYAFDSYFTVEVEAAENAEETGSSEKVTALGAGQEMPAITARKSYDFSSEVLSLIARIFLTIAAELVIALPFGFGDRKSFKVIAVSNAFTQILLNILLNIVNYRSGQWAFVLHYIWMEIVVFGVEVRIYGKMLEPENPGNGKRRHPCWYAFIANAVSFAVGLWIARAVPGIF